MQMPWGMILKSTSRLFVIVRNGVRIAREVYEQNSVIQNPGNPDNSGGKNGGSPNSFFGSMSPSGVPVTETTEQYLNNRTDVE